MWARSEIHLVSAVSPVIQRRVADSATQRPQECPTDRDGTGEELDGHLLRTWSDAPRSLIIDAGVGSRPPAGVESKDATLLDQTSRGEAGIRFASTFDLAAERRWYPMPTGRPRNVGESMSLRRRSTSIALPTTLLLALFGIATCAEAQATGDGPAVIVASGESVITVAPDQAWVTVSVDTRDARGPEARRLGAVAMTSVRAALTGTGLAADAVQTVGLALHPEYEYTNGRQRIRDFMMSNRLRVRVDDVTTVADVLDAVAVLALPPSSTLMIGELRFDVKDRADVERQALTQAVQDSTQRAAAMARGAGQTLGRILRIDEGRASDSGMRLGQPVMMSRAAETAIATPISPSDIEIRAQVTLTAEIE